MKKILLTILIGTLVVAVNCQGILTIGEVFDFNVDDEFHITNLAGLPSGYKATISDKWMSEYQDTVYYLVIKDNYYSNYNDQTGLADYYYKTYSEVLSYSNLDSSIYTLNYLIEYPEDSSLVFSYDSLIYFDTTLCDAQINGFSRRDGDFEPPYHHHEFGKGLGLTYQEDITGWHGEPDWVYKLVYYVKDGIKCGIPDNHLTRIERDFDANSRFEVYPTIAKNWIIVKDIKQGIPYEISLINLSGSQLAKETNLSGDHSLNLEGIPSGLYIIMIQSHKSIFMERIIKE